MLISELRNQNVLENLKELITANINTRISSFNEAMRNSNEYKTRENEIADEDDVCISLQSVIVDLESARNEYEVTSEEYKRLDESVERMDSQLDTRINEVLDKEFGIVDHYDLRKKYFGTTYLDEVIISKLGLTNVGNFEEIVDAIVRWYFDKIEVYI